MKELLEALRRHANNRGLVFVRESVLAEELSLSPQELRPLINALAASGKVEVLSSLPYLVLRLEMWSGRVPLAGDPYSSPKLLRNSARDSYRDDAVDQHDLLLAEILETLGESDPAAFRKAVENYSPHVIRIALSRVRSAKAIRKSRTALFRHLLPRIAAAAPTDLTKAS